MNMDALFGFLLDNYPFIGSAVVLAVFVWFVAGYHNWIRDTRNRVEGLPCDENGKKLDALVVKMDEYGNKIDSIGIGFENLCRELVRKEVINPVSYLQRYSPYKITETGQRLLEATGAKECVDANIEYFIDAIEVLNPQTAYDVEECCGMVIEKSIPKPIFKKIKDYVYASPGIIVGEMRVDISMKDVISVMRVYLRDKYLEIHSDLQPETAPELLVF